MRILVVDDHPIFLAGIEFLIRTHHPDYTVQSVSSAEAALEQLRWTRFHLVLLDLNLPGMDGVAFLHQLKQRNLDVPALAMSAETEARLVQRAILAGARGFLPKSFPHSQMLTAIEHVAAGQEYVPESVQAQIEELTDVGAITPRQNDVLLLIAEGLSNREIADQLNLTEYTVKSHVSALFHTLGCKNRTACVHEAKSLGIITDSRLTHFADSR